MKEDEKEFEVKEKIFKWDIDHVPDIKEYEAYVYKFSITLCREQKVAYEKIYIGAHKGHIYDPYDFSSEAEEFLKDLRNPDSEVECEVMAKGTVYDEFDLENQMLEKVNAKNNKSYYNKTNGGSRYSSQSAKIEGLIDSIIFKCNSGAFSKYEKLLSLEDIKKQMDLYGQIQIRDEDEDVANEDYTNDMADNIDLHNGKTHFLPPCLAFGNWKTKDGILWGDGTQRYTGVEKSKRGKKIKVIVLPKSEYVELLEKGKCEVTQHLIDLCFLRNPLTAAPLPMKPIELARNIVARSKDIGDVSSERQYRFLAKNRRTGKGAKRIISKAEILWKNKEKAGPLNHYHSPTSPEGKKILADKREEVENLFPNDIIITASSSNFGGGHIEGIVIQPVVDGRKYPTKIVKGDSQVIRPVIYHSNTDFQEDWEKGKGEKDRKWCKWICEGLGYEFAPYDYVSLIAPKVTSKATK